MRAVLTYHSIDESGSPISLDAATFQRHVRWFAASGPRVVGLEELLTLPATADAVAITFDDGFANFAEVAWPLLREHGLPATLFVVTDYVGRSNAWAGGRHAVPRLPLLGWEEIGRLAEEGVTVGAHTQTHPDLRRLAAAELNEELAGAAERIASEVGSKPRLLAYPFGWLDARVVAATRTVYAIACTTELRPLRPHEDPCRIPRLDSYYLRRPGRLEAWGTAGLRAYFWARATARRFRRGRGAAGWRPARLAHLGSSV